MTLCCCFQQIRQMFIHPHKRQMRDGNKAMSSETILQWKSTRTVNTDTVPCSKVVRVSPLKIYSSPSICLMKHICSGKAVCLISPDAPEV